MKYSNEQLLKMYENMVLARTYEEVTIEYLENGELNCGAWHMAMGEEGAQIGCVSALGPHDFYVPTHRCHGVLAVKLDLRKFTAECVCKSTGYVRGKSASVHISSISEGVLMANGILGAGMPIAVGYAVAMKKQKKESVVVAVIGDGASNEGNFYEAINLAGILEAPIVFFIENNGIGMSNPISNATKVKDLSLKGTAVGIPGVTVDGSDVLAVREAVEAAIAKARIGQPSIVEAKTCRYRSHSEGVMEPFRDMNALEEGKRNDPILKFGKVLTDLGLLDEAKKVEIADKMRARSVDAFDFAIASPDPSREETVDLNLVYKSLGGNLA
jgi:pyruvate dehydrogenase E1 component alpha subunit